MEEKNSNKAVEEAAGRGGEEVAADATLTHQNNDSKQEPKLDCCAKKDSRISLLENDIRKLKQEVQFLQVHVCNNAPPHTISLF